MQTRSSPALCTLRRLAQHADMSSAEYASLSKADLFETLRSRNNYDRLLRAQNLSTKREYLRPGEEPGPAPPAAKRKRRGSGCSGGGGGGSSSGGSSGELAAEVAPYAGHGAEVGAQAQAQAQGQGGPGNGHGEKGEDGSGGEGGPGAAAAAAAAGGGGAGAGAGAGAFNKAGEELGAGCQCQCQGRSSDGWAWEGRLRSGVVAGKGKGKGNSAGGRTSPSPFPSFSCSCSKGWSSAVEAKGGTDGLNLLDPIMFTELGKHQYKFVRPNGKAVVYNLESLVDFFLSTGDFSEPETRLPFSDKDLHAIDNQVVRVGLHKPSVLEARRNPSRFADEKFKRDALLGLERLSAEVVTSMLQVVERSDPEEGEMHLLMNIFPAFTDLYKQICDADREFAEQCMEHYISFLEGPPNRPTEDEVGFLNIILSFLRQLRSGGGSELGF